MKKILFILICLPFLAQAQIQTTGLVENKSDTIITKDPMDPGREYWVIHNMKGNISFQGFMRNGKREGVWREYRDFNGILYKLSEFKDNMLDGAVLTFTTTGPIESDETYLKGKKNGLRMTYTYFGGKFKLIENYKNDTLHGLRQSFYDDGKLQEEGNYINGKRDGVTKWYLQTGTLSMEYNYKLGDLEGPAKQFDEKGRIKQEGVYRNNNEEGEWKEYKDSVLTKKIIYKQGQILKEVPVKK